MKNRISWALLALLVAFPAMSDDSDWEARRQEALQRERRVIYNTDGCDALYFPRDLEPTRENFLSRRLIHTRGSRIDSVFYCPQSSGFGHFTCRKAGEPLLNDVPINNKVYNATRDFFRLGTDPLEMAIDFCHNEGLEIFASIRVNDTHDASGTLEEPHPLFPRFKQQHPECLMGAPVTGQRPPFCNWSAVDFAQKPVREAMKRFVREFCFNYDIDGIEYDFMRHMQLFKSVAWGGNASPEELDLMTELMTDLRKISEEEGRRRGRPILVAIRVPDSVEYCRGVGIDLEKWLENGLVDILITSSYFQLNPWKYSADLAKKYSVKFYPSLDESRIGNSRLPVPGRNSLPSYFARALDALNSGADGIYYFNMEGKSHLQNTMRGKVEDLADEKKAYFATVRGSGGYAAGFYLRGGAQFGTLPRIEPGEVAVSPVKFDISIGDDLDVPGSRAVVQAFAQVRAPKGTVFELNANGEVFRPTPVTGGILRFDLGQALHQGVNHFEFTSKVPEDREVEFNTILAGNVLLAGKNQAPWRRLFQNNVGATEKIVDGAYMLIDPDDGQSMPNLIYPLSGATQETSIRCKLKVEPGSTRGSVVMRIADGAAVEIINFEPDTVSFEYGGQQAKFDTTGRFHDYRVEIKRNDKIELWADGKLLLENSGLKNQPAMDSARELKGYAFSTDYMHNRSLLIGSLSASGHGAGSWKELELGDRDVYLEDFCVVIDYPELLPEALEKAASAEIEPLVKIDIVDGKPSLDGKVNSNYRPALITVEDGGLRLVHDSKERGADYQRFAVDDPRLLHPEETLIAEWRGRVIAASDDKPESAQVALVVEGKDGIRDVVVRIGADALATPWGRVVPADTKLSQWNKFRLAFDPETGRGALWINDRYVTGGPVKVAGHREKPFIYVGDASGGISGVFGLADFRLGTVKK